MDEKERERLTKAKDSAFLLLSDLRAVVTKTDNLALEELIVEAVEQVQKLHRRLKRFAEQQL
jgi:hypothetical protein